MTPIPPQNQPIVEGATSVIDRVWYRFLQSLTVAPPTPLLAGNNLSDLTDKSIARNDLGLKSAALHDATDFLGSSITALSMIPIAFISAPNPPLEGMLVNFVDSSTATWGATVTGGGSNHVLARYNGTRWTVVGA
jgi:hypothetical protein